MDMRPRDILAENFNKLRKVTPKLFPLKAITAASGVPNGTLGRIQSAGAATSVDYLEPIARAFGLQAWQLLVPGLVIETGTNDKPKVSGPPVWPFSRELARAIEQLDPGELARLEALIRLHLRMDKDTGEALSYHVPTATVSGTSSARQEPPAIPVMEHENARRPGVKKDGRSKGNRSPGG